MRLPHTLDSIKNLESWQLLLLPVIGALNVFAFIPYEHFWIPFFTIPLLMQSIFQCTSPKKSFLIGWLYGFGFLGVGLYWFNNALLTDKDAFGWLFPISILAIPLVISLYYGVFTYVAFRLKTKSSTHFYLSFCCLWITFEITRTYLFSGFPWLVFGYIYGFNINLAQSISIAGIFGTSLLAIGTYSLSFLANKPDKGKIFIISIIIILNICAYIYGYKRLDYQDTQQPTTIRIIQPNINQFHYWSRADKSFYLNKLLMMSNIKLPKSTKYVIWPEVPTPLNLFYNKTSKYISQNLPRNTVLISNSLRFAHKNIFNSSIFLKNGSVVGHYDKSRLVPFGEYIPFRNLPIISKVTHGTMDFTAGRGLKTTQIDKEKFMILICFESFFPIQHTDKTRPDLLINLTNDAWYGKSQGPYLHYQMSQFRAIETNTPLIRAANTGISTMFDSRGRTKRILNLNEQGYLDFHLVKSNDKSTIYEKYHILQALLFTIIMILIYVKNLKTCQNVYRNEKC